MRQSQPLVSTRSIRSVGIVATPNISVGGGFARVTVDFIRALHSLGKNVSLLTPYPLDKELIEKFHGTLHLDKVYTPRGLRGLIKRPDPLSRRALKQAFQTMAREVDLIIDLDGTILHNYLPAGFDPRKYVVWRVSCPHSGLENIPLRLSNASRIAKELLRKSLVRRSDLPEKGTGIYAIDAWTKQEVKDYWNRVPRETCFYTEINAQDLRYKGQKKKNQIVIFGRISPNKAMDESIRIFARGTQTHPDHSLVIMGGATPDSEGYISYLKRVAAEEGVLDKMQILASPSFDTLKRVLLESKVLIDSQAGVSITLTAAEGLAAGCIVLAAKNGGTYLEILDKGTYGFGFDSVAEGGRELSRILDDLKSKKLTHSQFVSRVDFFSRKNFINRVGTILNEINTEVERGTGNL